MPTKHISIPTIPAKKLAMIMSPNAINHFLLFPRSNPNLTIYETDNSGLNS